MSKYCVGVDVGGTTVKLGIFTECGTLVDKWEIPTRKENEGAAILPDIAASIQEKLAGGVFLNICGAIFHQRKIEDFL